MHGNVFELCWDWYGSYTNEAKIDPVGPESGTNRIRRGGAWSDYSMTLRSAFRNAHSPSGRNTYLGFRVVRPFQ